MSKIRFSQPKLAFFDNCSKSILAALISVVLLQGSAFATVLTLPQYSSGVLHVNAPTGSGSGYKNDSEKFTKPGSLFIVDSGQYYEGGFSPWYANAVLAGQLIPSPGFIAYAIAGSSGPAVSADVNVTLTYEVEVVADPGVVPVNGVVPVTILASGRATSQGSGMGSATFGLLGLHEVLGGPAINLDLGTASSTESIADNFNLDEPVPAEVGVSFGVTMQVSVSASDSAQGKGYSRADVSLDPRFLVPAGYSVLLSPGVGNAAAPEASTWLMMLAGFGALAALARAKAGRTKPELLPATGSILRRVRS